jgi:gas vesicle protein GvpA/GvpJ/GvpM family
MSASDPRLAPGFPQTSVRSDLRPHGGGPANLADILERVLDKGIVIAGDIQINLLDIELLTIKIRLLICSVDRAQEMGINWWESDPRLSGDAKKELERENEDLRARLERVERMLENGGNGQ